MECETVLKIQEGRPNAADLMKNGDIAMMFITSTGDEPDVRDGKNLRRSALSLKIPIITTVAGAKATTQVLLRSSLPSIMSVLFLLASVCAPLRAVTYF